MKNDFKFCPACSATTIQNVKMRKWYCPECGFDLYNNVATAVGLIICDSDGCILLERRGKEPRKGFLAFPGGFADPDETAEEACMRECLEETGVKPVFVKYAGSFPNTYEYKNIVYKTCDLFFEAKLPENADLKAQEGEVLGFEKWKCTNEEELEQIPLAFDSARKILKKWLGEK